MGSRAHWLVKNLLPSYELPNLFSCEISCTSEYCGRNTKTTPWRKKKKKRWQDQVKTNSNYSWTWLACTHSPRTQTWAEGTSKEEMHKQHLRKAKHHQEHCINSCVFLQKIRLQSSVLLLRYYGYLIKFFHLSFYSLEAIKPQ